MSQQMEKRSGLIAWALYDWANSPYAAVIQTFVFATYFTQRLAIDEATGTPQWGQMLAISGGSSP